MNKVRALPGQKVSNHHKGKVIRAVSDPNTTLTCRTNKRGCLTLRREVYDEIFKYVKDRVKEKIPD